MPPTITLFLAGDVMTGRGIDQVLPHPGDPRLQEPWVRDARIYAKLAERVNGPIPAPVDYGYIWGDVLEELERRSPNARIVNLETSVTADGMPCPDKEIHYRMHPVNIGCLTAAELDCCVLANNHVLDFGRGGLTETIATLHAAGLHTAGAGANANEAAAPAVIELEQEQRVLVFAFGNESSGIPAEWAAGEAAPGVHMIRLSATSGVRAAAAIERAKLPGDVVVASLHWGPNWGYSVPADHRAFAHALIDSGAVDVVHGHSSHHAKGVEVYRDKLILYGCGDFITDYEGIGGHESYRADLSPMYVAEVDAADGRLVSVEVTPFQMRRFSLRRTGSADVTWLKDMFDREGAELGTKAELVDGRIAIRWPRKF